MVDKVKALFGSRKFYASLIGSVLVCVNSQIKLMDDVQMASLIGIVGSWIIGQGMADGKK